MKISRRRRRSRSHIHALPHPRRRRATGSGSLKGRFLCCAPPAQKNSPGGSATGSPSMLVKITVRVVLHTGGQFNNRLYASLRLNWH